MHRRANTQTQQEAVQENAAVEANTGADMQMEAAITKTQPEKGVLDVYKRQVPAHRLDGRKPCRAEALSGPAPCNLRRRKEQNGF